MKEEKIKVLKVEPCKTPKVVTLVNELEELQKAVSIGADYVGLIEIIAIDDDICILCNEEGKLLGLEPNRRIGHDVICGVFYIVRVKDGKLQSLTDADVVKYSLEYWATESFTKDDLEDYWL